MLKLIAWIEGLTGIDSRAAGASDPTETGMDHTLEFKGYWPIESADAANFPGIYCVYAVPQDHTTSTSRLLYIGESSNIGERIKEHQLNGTFKRSLSKDFSLYFNACRMTTKEGRREAEAALIHHHQPPYNVEFKTDYPYRTATVTITGQNAGLTPGFVITEFARA